MTSSDDELPIRDFGKLLQQERYCKDLIKVLINEANSLPSFVDESLLETLRAKTEATILEVFGENSRYLYAFEKTSPDLLSLWTEDPVGTDEWNHTKEKMLLLYSHMLGELEYFGRDWRPPMSDRIFIICEKGCGIAAEIEDVLKRILLEPIILQRKEGEFLVDQILEYENIKFAIVVSDFATKHNQLPGILSGFELGFITGIIGEKGVFVLRQRGGRQEVLEKLPVSVADYAPQGKWLLEMVRSLRKSGYRVDANRLL